MGVNNSSTIPTPATPDVCTVKILIGGEEISSVFEIMSVTVSRQFNRIPAATVIMRDGEAATATFRASNTEHFIPGKNIEIQLGYRAQDEAVFKGIIIKNSIKVRQNGSMLIIDCRDEAVKMTAGRKSSYFTDRKDSDILEDVIGTYGLQHDIAATSAELKEVVQYDSTDWDFILCRAEANGHLVRVEDGKVLSGPPEVSAEPVVQVQYGATLLELDAEMDARWQSPGIKAMSWNATDQEVLEAEASEPPTTENGNIPPADLADVLGGEAHALLHGGKISQPELQAWANGRLLKERLAKVRGRARFQGLASVLPGQIIEVAGIGERFEGKLLVAGVRHQVAAGNWETDVEFGLDPRLFAEVYDIRPLPSAGLLPAVSGLHTGVVTVLEGDPDNEFRIKVRLPLVSTAEEGVWARIATLDAGNERGTFFLPEIGDEVLVGFLHDDPRYPVVLGMLHSSAHPAPETATDDNHIKSYVSREKMVFRFDDENKVITLETPSGNSLVLSEEDKGIKITDENGNTITLDDNGITIESTKDLILKAAKDIKIEGTNINMAATANLKVEGSGSAELSGASTTVKGSANTVIQGGIVQIN
ncbi:MAG: type VI secretion system tip protein VgrG [Bacteroidetes bacterium]|nr:MAG: type VI secretion system tip protein VgrG [Bacteroidota bacterium]